MTHEVLPNEDLWPFLGPAEDIPAEPLPGVEIGDRDPDEALQQRLDAQ